MRTTLVALLFAIAFVMSVAANDVADTKALQGTWLLVKGDLAGRPLPLDTAKPIVMKLDKNDYVVTADGQPDKGTWSIDSSTTPKSMVVKGVKGPNAGKTYPCIYEIEGDTLRICYNLSGMKRPTEFKTRADTELFLATYERKK